VKSHQISGSSAPQRTTIDNPRKYSPPVRDRRPEPGFCETDRLDAGTSGIVRFVFANTLPHLFFDRSTNAQFRRKKLSGHNQIVKRASSY
jgi:hypothetical protein